MQSVSQKVSYHQRYNVIVTEIFYYIQIIYYVQILSYHSHIFFDTNVFRYTLVLFFSDTNIFKRTNLTCAPKSPKVKWLKLFTHRIIYKENYFPFLFQLCFNFQLYHTSKIQHLSSNIKPNVKKLIRTCSYIQIFSDTDIGSYHIRIICLIQMYWDIHSYNFWSYKYIRIFAHILDICLDINICIKHLYSSHPAVVVICEKFDCKVGSLSQCSNGTGRANAKMPWELVAVGWKKLQILANLTKWVQRLWQGLTNIISKLSLSCWLFSSPNFITFECFP